MRKNRKNSWGYLILTLALLGSLASLETWAQDRTREERARIAERRARMTPRERAAERARLQARCGAWDRISADLPVRHAAAVDALDSAQRALDQARASGSADAPRLRAARNRARDEVAVLAALMRDPSGRSVEARRLVRSGALAEARRDRISRAYTGCMAVRGMAATTSAIAAAMSRERDVSPNIVGEGMPASEHHDADSAGD